MKILKFRHLKVVFQTEQKRKEKNIIQVTSSISGRVLLSSSLNGKIDFKYEVKSSYIPYEMILNALNEKSQMNYEIEDINLDLTRNIVAIELTESSSLFDASSEYIDNLFPHLEKVIFKCNRGYNNFSYINVPSSIETIYFESAFKSTKNNYQNNFAPISHSIVYITIEGNTTDLNVIFDGSFYLSSSDNISKTATGIFSNFKTLNFTSKNGHMDMEASDGLTCFSNIVDLYINIDKFSFDNPESDGNYKFDINYGVILTGAKGYAADINGKDAINCENLHLKLTRAFQCNGGDGLDGKVGDKGVNNGQNGGKGCTGELGGTGGSGIVANTMHIESSDQDNAVILLSSGAGGDGGDGGDGSDGKNCSKGFHLDRCNPGNGGDGGDGASGGDSGYPLYISTSITGNMNPLTSVNSKIIFKKGGLAGDSGNVGKAGKSCWLSDIEKNDGNISSALPMNGFSHLIYYKNVICTYEDFITILKK